MTITDRAALVLQQIDEALVLTEKATPGPWETQQDPTELALNGIVAQYEYEPREFSSVWVTRETSSADSAFIATSRTLLPASLRCFKTAIEGLLQLNKNSLTDFEAVSSHNALTTLCDQWEAGR